MLNYESEFIDRESVQQGISRRDSAKILTLFKYEVRHHGQTQRLDTFEIGRKRASLPINRESVPGKKYFREKF